MNLKNEMKITIGMVQINEKFEGMAREEYQRSISGKSKEIAVLPYSVGLLQAYVLKHAENPEQYKFLLPIYKRTKVSSAVEYLQKADIVAFSSYVWNINLSLAIAKEIKRINKDILIVFGGPQVPNSPEEFLAENPFIDIVAHGEGEELFLAILENYKSRNWETVPSVSYLTAKGEFKTQPKKIRHKNLDDFPSPYLEGIFEPLINSRPQTFWVMLWETNRGCPFSCSFCDWGSATNSKIFKFDVDRLFRELQWFALLKGEMIFCCDANFGIFERDYELTKFASLMKQWYGYPRILSVQNTKNATDRSYKIQKLLTETNLNPKVTISLQSVSTQSLAAIKRSNISTEHFNELQSRCNKEKIPTYTDIILGLPDETYDSFLDGISSIIEGGQHSAIQFFNLTILPNAEMGSKAYQEKYGLVSIQQSIIKMHDPYPFEEECPEFITTVIATASMPGESWILSKCYSWLIELLNFDYILKIPLVVLSAHFNISIRKLSEPFLHPDPTKHPIISGMIRFMKTKALNIQNGGPEFIGSKEWLGIYWSVEEYAFIHMVLEDNFDLFYKEAEDILTDVMEKEQPSCNRQIIKEVCELNKNLVCLPFNYEDRTIKMDFTIWEYFQSIINGEKKVLNYAPAVYEINVAKNIHTSIETWLDHWILCKNLKERTIYDLKKRASENIYSQTENAM